MKRGFLAMLGGVGVALVVAMVLAAALSERPRGRASDPSPMTSSAASEARKTSGPEGGVTLISSPDEGSSALETVNVRLEAGDTLLGTLVGAGIPYEEAYGASQGLKSTFEPRRLKAGQEIRLRLMSGGENADTVHLERLALIPKTDRMVVLEHRPDEGFEVSTQAIEHASQLVSAAGEIGTSLYQAARGQGVPMLVLLQAYRVLGHAVDFQRDIREGDTFALGYESLDDGQFGEPHAGKLMYASLTIGERRALEVYRYTTSDGYAGFFDADGRSIETSLMKSPVDGGRLSSLFGKRNHPILGYTRMHKGLDFAAPRGAPVLAAGDGVVTRRSRYGGFGNYIRIEHDGTYATAYAHLSRYADELDVNDRVRQGQVIGYVGATGLATGPNLHYEVRENGSQVNPMALELPPRRTLAGDELARFRRVTADLLAALAAGATGTDARTEADTPGTGAADG